MKVSPQKVLIVGTYSGLNKGDRLMQQVAIDAVKNMELKPILSSPFPEIDRSIYPDTQVVKCKRRNLPISVFQCFLMLIIPRYFRRIFASKNKEIKDYLEAEFIIDTSGDMLTEDYGVLIALSHAIPLIYCVLLEKNTLIFAQSIGPFKKLRILYIKLLSKAECVTARDSITYEYLVEQGLSNVVKTADLGFLLEPKKYNVEQKFWLPKNQNKFILGICPSALFFRKFAKKYRNSNLKYFCLMLDRISKERNISFLLIPHVMTPNGKYDDDDISAQMKELLEVDCSVVGSEIDPASVKYIISKLDGVISFRMHGAIAALDSKVPTIAVAYSHKTIGLFESLGIADWVVNNDHKLIDNLYNLINSLLDNSADLKAQLAKSVPLLRQEARKNLDILARMKHL